MRQPPLPERMREQALAQSATISDFKKNLRAAYDERYGSAVVHTQSSVIVNPMVAKPPSNETEIAQQRHAMAFADGRYPVGMSDCHVVGISGGCGARCPVLLGGRCDSEEMHEVLAYGPVQLEDY
jgi:hypothetical protein